MKKILIRVDISNQIGGGHLMRMIGLGQFLFDEGYEIHIASIPYQANLIESLLDRSFHLHLFDNSQGFIPEFDLENLIVLAKNLQSEWIILDGYHFPIDYEKRIRSEGFRSMRVDDLPNKKCEADILLNHNHGAELFEYKISLATTKLTGLKHLLLRREFRHIDVAQKKFSEIGAIRLLVCLGGGSKIADILNLKIIKALSETDGIIRSAHIIVGKMGTLSNENLAMAREASFPITMTQFQKNIAEEMLNADIAITAGGYSMWELLYLKTPYLVVSLNAAQEKYTRFLADEGLCEVLGLYEHITSAQIKQTLLAFIKNESFRKAMIEKSEILFNRVDNGKRLLQILAN